MPAQNRASDEDLGREESKQNFESSQDDFDELNQVMSQDDGHQAIDQDIEAEFSDHHDQFVNIRVDEEYDEAE